MKNVIKTIICAHIIAAHGAERVTIKRSGEVIAYGKMPNTNKIGSWFAGYADEIHSHIKSEAGKYLNA